MRLLVAALAVVVAAPAAFADTITINATDRGWYRSDSYHDPSNDAYVVGGYGGTDEFHDFFVFDLGGVAGTITAARLRLFNPAAGFEGGATETFGVFHVSTDLAALVAGTGGAAAFNDLGSGTSYGSYAASAADNGTFVVIDLNASAIGDLDGASGLFGFGGALTTVDGTPYYQYFFGSSGVGFADAGARTQLILTTSVATPEPGTIGLFGLGALGLGAWVLRRRRRATA